MQGQLESATAQLAEANRARQEAAGRVAQLEAQIAAQPVHTDAGLPSPSTYHILPVYSPEYWREITCCCCAAAIV